MSMSDEDLIKEVAEVVMQGAQFDTYINSELITVWKFHGINGIPVDEWNPLTNANHLELVRDKVRDHFDTWIETMEGQDTFSISIWDYAHDKELASGFVEGEDCKKDWPKTQLEAMLEAVKKMEG